MRHDDPNNMMTLITWGRNKSVCREFKRQGGNIERDGMMAGGVTRAVGSDHAFLSSYATTGNWVPLLESVGNVLRADSVALECGRPQDSRHAAVAVWSRQ